MSWTAWLISCAVVFLPGAFFVRAGKLKVAAAYVIACVVLGVAWVFNVGAMFGEASGHWPRTILGVLAPGSVILAIWAIHRDRMAVLGAAHERDTLVAAALLTGGLNSHSSDPGDTGDAGAGGE